MPNDTWRIPAPERDETFRNLIGASAKTPYPHSITDPSGGGKFAPDGSTLPYPGNTFLCHLDPESRFFAAVSAMQDRLRSSRFAHYFSFLPKPSFHMTIFCGVSGVALDAEGWPEDVPAGVGLNEINQLFESRLSQVSGPASFSVQPRSLYPNSIRLCAANKAEETKLRDMRNRLADATGLHRADHETYEFHASMGYLLQWIPEEDVDALLMHSEQSFAEHLAEIGNMNLGPAEFCDFENMHGFRTRGWVTVDGYRSG